MGEINESSDVKDVAETKEATEAKSEIDEDMSSKYDEYLEKGKDKDFEYKQSDEKDVDEVPEIKGGSYKDIKDNMAKRGETGEEYEVHHTPANSCTELSENDGPAIKMEKGDHRETASCGSSRDAKEYRTQQKELIDEGKFDEAIQMDIDDIHDKFEGKYDEGISEMLEYSKTIKNGRN